MSQTKLILTPDQQQDVVNLAKGLYQPLTGFLTQADFHTVVEKMHLKNGQVWPIPIVLDINQQQKKRFQNQEKLELVGQTGELIAYLHQPEIYQYDKHFLAENVFGTRSLEHPGVADVFAMKDYLIGGQVELVRDPNGLFRQYNWSPAQTKAFFKKQGWQKIVAFQTRNVPHRGHEFLQKQALKKVDGLMIQPVIGEKKLRDFKDEYIMACYQALIEQHYPQEKTLLTILPLKMRYAGPREAVMHALIRRNFGCTHFIVGRDHAGVGGFYDPFAAQKIFDQFNQAELGIKILKFKEVVYDQNKKKHCFIDQAKLNDRVYFSGTKLREAIYNKSQVPNYLARPVVLNILKNGLNTFVDQMYKDNQKTPGFVLWFTGLSGSGKSTIADAVFKLLAKQGFHLERLDGDVVRESLTKDLGFSKKDRDENIKRVGFVANLLSRNGVGVIASFISPYQAQRRRLRKKIHNFIEVYISTPLKICEQRDVKGLYQQARQGKIKNFTGISDPYEAPQNPEIEIKAVDTDPQPYAQQIVTYLQKHDYLTPS
ncbi:MAG: sulfate adenylyltransferase [Candidatus Pacebacteria bacterium]|nr:sulfate adenylyltransferase [Candidatus Paceibacterota bacterium]